VKAAQGHDRSMHRLQQPTKALNLGTQSSSCHEVTRMKRTWLSRLLLCSLSTEVDNALWANNAQ